MFLSSYYSGKVIIDACKVQIRRVLYDLSKEVTYNKQEYGTEYMEYQKAMFTEFREE
jgi:hypothetical protein